MNNQEYNLVKIIEECAEVQEACTKILRFGMHGKVPQCDNSNLDRLRLELGDLTVAIQLLEYSIGESLEISEDELDLKRGRFTEFKDVSGRLGRVTL